MNNIVNENSISFKELEQNIFQAACHIARKTTKELLESRDDEIAAQRDKKKYRNKGKRRTSIKTVYGEVEYERRVYERKLDDGKRAYVYLLEEQMKMDKIGLISSNLAEKIAQTVVESPFRITAEVISNTCGQCISHGGVWNLTQKIGEKISEEEDFAVKQMEAGRSTGQRQVEVLFEEMDGLWLKMQKGQGKKAAGKEMKIATTYEGWDADSKKASRLVGKTVIAGMEKSEGFLKKREAQISNIYDVDEIGLRILNGDGGSWIGDPYADELIEQLDRFHIVKEIKGKIWDEEYQAELLKLLEKDEVDGLLEAVQIYADSVATNEIEDKREEKALELLKYLKNNEEKIKRYDNRGKEIPQAPKGMVYKHMGVQENQNATVIASRMKHGRKRWSISGAEHMAKLLYCHENKTLVAVVNRYTDETIWEEIQGPPNTLSAAKAPKKDGRGNIYIEQMTAHMPILDSANYQTIKMLKRYLMS